MANLDRIAVLLICLLVLLPSGFPGHAAALIDSYRLGSVIAVRLGNTRSCVAGYGNDHAVFRFCIPSWAAFSEDGAVLVGQAAKDHAAVNPQAAVFGFKRLLGKKFGHEDVQRAAESFPYKIVYNETVNTGTGIQVGKQLLHVEDVAAMVLAELKGRAEAYIGHKVPYAVLTVPNYFRDASRLAAFDAVELAGLEPVRVIDEPTAAALAHGLHKDNEIAKNVLVLHVGGGTTDATVLVHEDGVFEAIGTCHDARLGGDDLDRRTAGHFVGLIREKHGVDISNDTAKLGKLRAECERAKKELSDRDVTHLDVESVVGGVDDLSEPLTRAKFEELNRDLFGRIMAVVDEAMVGIGSELAEKKELVDEIVLVGGSSRMPRIRELISDYFGGREVRIGTTAVEPDEAVVHGGALLSHPTAGGYECLDGERRQFGAATDMCRQELGWSNQNG